MGGGKLVPLVLFLLLLPLAFAQTCEFYDLEPYTDMEMKLVYEDTNVVAADDLTSLQFTNITMGQINKTLFSVYNPNDFEVVAFFSYEVEGTGALIRDSTNPSSITLPPKTTVESQPELCIDTALGISGPCGIKPETVTYSVRKRLLSGGLEPKTMRPKLAEISKKRPIPNKPCPNGNSDCFTNKCNRMGYCDTKINVSCCDGKQLCNDYCSSPGSKNVGEAYNCDWECNTGYGDGKTCKLSNNLSCTLDSQCASGICNSDGYCGNVCTEGKQICNQRYCREPSSKGEDQQYECDWECNKDDTIAANGICVLTPAAKAERRLHWVIFGLATPLAVIIILLLIKINSLKNLDKTNRALEEAKRKNKSLEKEHKNTLSKLEKQQDTISKQQKNLNSVQDELNKKQATYEQTLRDLHSAEIRRDRLLESIHNKDAQLKQQQHEINEQSKKIEESVKKLNEAMGENKQLEEIHGKLKKELDILKAPIPNPWGGGKVWCNPDKNWYYCYWNGPSGDNGTLIHRELGERIFKNYKEQYEKLYPSKKFDNLRVHHLDANKFNNHSDNLVIVDKLQHPWGQEEKDEARRKNVQWINHSNIEPGNRDSGIKELKRLKIKAPNIPELN